MLRSSCDLYCAAAGATRCYLFGCVAARLASLARYDLLVNRFLKSKIVRRGLGPTHEARGDFYICTNQCLKTMFHSGYHIQLKVFSAVRA